MGGTFSFLGFFDTPDFKRRPAGPRTQGLSGPPYPKTFLQEKNPGSVSGGPGIKSSQAKPSEVYHRSAILSIPGRLP